MDELSKVEKLIAEKSVCVVLLQGNNLTGEPIWAYVAIRLIDLEKFMDAQKSGNFDPEELGVIVEAGLGAAPSDEIKEKMRQEYGFNHDKMLNLTNPLESKE